MNKGTAVACAAIKKLVVQGLEKVKAQELLEIIFPFWVEEESAKPVTQLALAETATRGLSLDTEEPYTVHSYIGRSSYRSLTHDFCYYELHPPQLQDSFQDFKDQILKAVIAESGITGKNIDQRAKDIIKERSSEDISPEPVFVFFPPNMVPDVPLLDKLREEFETVTFFVLAGDESEEKLKQLSGKIHILQPLDRQKETKALNHYYMLKGSLKNKGQNDSRNNRG